MYLGTWLEFRDAIRKDEIPMFKRRLRLRNPRRLPSILLSGMLIYCIDGLIDRQAMETCGFYRIR